jgi:hypothetical protein
MTILSLLKDKVDFGMKIYGQGIIPRLDKTWRLNQVRLGYKKPNGEEDIWSYIVIQKMVTTPRWLQVPLQKFYYG